MNKVNIPLPALFDCLYVRDRFVEKGCLKKDIFCITYKVV